MSDPFEVANQSGPLGPFDAYTTDPALVSVVRAYDAGWVEERASALGQVVGTPEVAELAHLANVNGPELHTHDRFGHRLDEVRFHPSYHQLMALGKEHEVHAIDWVREGTPGAVVGRCALMYLYAQADAGVQCPMTMTHAVVPALRHDEGLAAQWLPQVLAPVYEPALAPRDQKQSATFGMAMTEKQGGSDVRSNRTEARPAGDGSVRLWGHKWFCSAPMCDAFLTLAQGEEGLGCYLVPRMLDDRRNPFLIQRLKSKLGDRSNASCEVEFRDTVAFPLGAPSRGIATILEMVEQTRIDICVGAAAMMRQVVRHAVHHARHRAAFGRPLVAQPLMRNVLADLALEVEASVALAFRLARAHDRRAESPHEAALARVMTPISKYWLAKQVVGVAFEAMECHGGNGYVEDWPLARIYRQAPLGSIWEGSGNVQCLDVLRALRRSPETREALVAEVEALRGVDPRLDQGVDQLIDELSVSAEESERRARRLVARAARVLQAGALIPNAPSPVGEAFLAGRLGHEAPHYGALDAQGAFSALIERALPTG